MAPFDAWENFYVIVGSSAGALTGLQFVVMALIAESRMLPKSASQVDAFGTPTVVHFCAVLLLSAILSAPWERVSQAGWVLTFCGLAGIIYTIIVVRRAHRQTGYKPVFEDWVWHTILPLIAYAGLTAGGLTVATRPVAALFTIGAIALILLFAGIHNAWDTVAYVVVGEGRAGSASDDEPTSRK